MRQIGILGCGNIARIIARHRDELENLVVVAVFDVVPERTRALAEEFEEAVPCSSFEEFIEVDLDTVIEAASVDAVSEHAETILEKGKDLVVMSVGALADQALRRRLEKTAAAANKTIRVPSGALFGLDNIKVGQVSELGKVILRSTKKPEALGLETGERTLLFKGPAEDCIKLYPKNVNVAVALSLAAEHEVEVELWADPEADGNIHEIIATGDFGQVDIQIRNVPSPDNPATSYLAALSIITLLKNLDRPLHIGV